MSLKLREHPAYLLEIHRPRPECSTAPLRRRGAEAAEGSAVRDRRCLGLDVAWDATGQQEPSEPCGDMLDTLYIVCIYPILYISFQYYVNYNIAYNIYM